MKCASPARRRGQMEWDGEGERERDGEGESEREIRLTILINYETSNNPCTEF